MPKPAKDVPPADEEDDFEDPSDEENVRIFTNLFHEADFFGLIGPLGVAHHTYNLIFRWALDCTLF